MAKLPPIRITKSDRKEYSRLRANTQAKIRRTKQNYGVDLSTEIDLPKIETFKTRKEFNEWKERQERFTNRAVSEFQFVKNKYGVVASKKEIREIERDTKQAQRVARERIAKTKNVPTFHDGKQIGTVGERGKYMQEPDITGVHVPSDFKFDEVRNRRRLEDIRESMSKRKTHEHFDKRNEQMLDNYIDLVRESLNSHGDEVIKELQSINPDDFYGLYLSNFTVFNFDIYYTETLDELIGLANTMVDIIKEHKNSDYYNPL